MLLLTPSYSYLYPLPPCLPLPLPLPSTLFPCLYHPLPLPLPPAFCPCVYPHFCPCLCPLPSATALSPHLCPSPHLPLLTTTHPPLGRSPSLYDQAASPPVPQSQGLQYGHPTAQYRYTAPPSSASLDDRRRDRDTPDKDQRRLPAQLRPPEPAATASAPAAASLRRMSSSDVLAEDLSGVEMVSDVFPLAMLADRCVGVGWVGRGHTATLIDKCGCGWVGGKGSGCARRQVCVGGGGEGGSCCAGRRVCQFVCGCVGEGAAVAVLADRCGCVGGGSSCAGRQVEVVAILVRGEEG